MLSHFVFVSAVFLVGMMGFAIQRGSTCVASAVHEWVHHKSSVRFSALIEAAFWALAGFLLLRGYGKEIHIQAFEITHWTLIGGALLGVGAFINGGCILGSVVRFSNGEWFYLLTPLGIYVGARMSLYLLKDYMPAPLPEAVAFYKGDDWWYLALGIALISILIYRFIKRLHQLNDQGIPHWQKFHLGHWDPHTATIIVGMMSLGMLFLVGAWSYADLLKKLAVGGATETLTLQDDTILFLALWAGALLGGLSNHSFKLQHPSLGAMTQCFLGGALMGLGAIVVPGGNDSLLMVGVPLGMSYAWVAFSIMILSVAIFHYALKGIRKVVR